MRSLAWAFAVRLCDKYRNFTGWLILCAVQPGKAQTDWRQKLESFLEPRIYTGLFQY